MAADKDERAGGGGGGSVTLQIHVSSAIVGPCARALASGFREGFLEARTEGRIGIPRLKLTAQVWTYLVNLKLAIVQGEFEAAAVVKSLSLRGSNQQS